MSDERADDSNAAGQGEEAGAKRETPLYDADAEQTFFFNFQGTGRNASKFYPVSLTFKPMADGDYIAYDCQRDVRMVGASDGVNASNETLVAAAWLGKKLFAKVVGWSASDKKFDERLADAVQSGLLACDIEPRPAPIEGNAEEDKPWEDDGPEPIKLRCLAEGRLIVTEHTPGDVGDRELDRLRKLFTRLKTKAKLVEDAERVGQRATKVPSRAEEKGRLYHALKFTAKGYKGRVPLHHKETVVDDFFAVEQELVEGKSFSSSPQ